MSAAADGERGRKRASDLGFGDINGFDLKSMGLAVLGGLVVLFLFALLTRGRS